MKRKTEMKQMHTKKQIEETIYKWTAYLLENKMIDEDEAKELLGEALFKRAIAALKKAGKKVASKFGQIVVGTAKNLHDQFATNSGVKAMIAALDKIKAKAPKFDFSKVRLFVTLDNETFPVIRLAMAKGAGKSKLFLLMNQNKKDAKPVTLVDLKNFFFEKLGKTPDIKNEIDGVYCAEVPEDMLSESKLTDYIEKENLTAKTAKKPENIKILKKLTKQGEQKVLAAIDKYFAKKDSESGKEDNTSKKTNKTKKSGSKKKSTNKPKKTNKTKNPASSSASTNDEPTLSDEVNKEETAAEVQAKDTDEKPIDLKDAKKVLDDSMKLFNNDFETVAIKGNDVSFMFGKNKEQIALDNAQVNDFFKS